MSDSNNQDQGKKTLPEDPGCLGAIAKVFNQDKPASEQIRFFLQWDVVK